MHNPLPTEEGLSMRLKNFDLIGLICFAVLNVGWVQIPIHPLIVGIILAVPLVFILPGYALAQCLFHKQSSEPASSHTLELGLQIDQSVGAVDQIIFSLGLSMAIDVLAGFMLNILPIGLQAQSWVIFLGITTTVFALLAAYFRRKNIVKIASTPRLHITIGEYMLFGLAILVVVAAVWDSMNRPVEQPQPSFTQLWMLPSNQMNNSCVVSIGIESFESTSVTYRVVMTVNEAQVNTWSSISLAPQGKWGQLVSIRPGITDTMYIETQLYRADKPKAVYRDVHLTMNSVRATKNGQIKECTTGT
jgi:uncharacterized membrane protein